MEVQALAPLVGAWRTEAVLPGGAEPVGGREIDQGGGWRHDFELRCVREG